jgi:hypothetical protein
MVDLAYIFMTSRLPVINPLWKSKYCPTNEVNKVENRIEIFISFV